MIYFYFECFVFLNFGLDETEGLRTDDVELLIVHDEHNADEVSENQDKSVGTNAKSGLLFIRLDLVKSFDLFQGLVVFGVFGLEREQVRVRGVDQVSGGCFGLPKGVDHDVSFQEGVIIRCVNSASCPKAADQCPMQLLQFQPQELYDPYWQAR